MYNPVEIRFENLMSYPNDSLSPELQTSIIYGENNYDKGQKNNGAGKSGAIEAFAIALVDNPLRKGVTITDFIKDGEDEMNIYLKLDNAMLNISLEIERTYYRKVSKAQEVVIKENGVFQEITNVNHANSMILEYLGIQRDDLLNYYLISQDRYKSFFGFSDNDKKQIISRFSSIQLIDPVMETINTDIQTLKNTTTRLTLDKSTSEGKLQAFQEQLEREENRNLDQELKDTITEYESSIVQAQANITQSTNAKVSLNEKLATTTNQIATLQTQIDSNEIDIKAVETSITTITSSFTKLYEEKDAIVKKDAQANALLTTKTNCPKCNFEFSPHNAEIDIEKVRAAIPIIKAMEVEINNSITKANTDSQDLTQKKSSLDLLKQQASTQIKNLSTELQNNKLSLQEIDNNISKFEAYIVSQQALIEQIKNTGINSNTESLKTSIKQEELSIEGVVKALDNNNNDVEHKEQLANQFTNFKSSLVNKTVKVIEFHCNRVLTKIGSSLSVNIEGYRLKRDGKTLVEKITTTVHREGFPIGNFHRFSTGERARIEISNILALQSLINSASSSGGLNLLFLDEIISSIDSEGITGILTELNDSFKKPIFIITHATYNGSFDNTIKIVKDYSGNSYIEIV